MNSCKKHKKYKAIRKPVSTEKHPDGCKDCWDVYNNIMKKNSTNGI